ARVTKLDCEPNGRFTRELEPLPEALSQLGKTVREAGADLGIASDPDADRAAFVDAAGVPLGEEYTVALGTRAALETQRGPVVTNLSTSRMLDAVCEQAGVPLHRTRGGEVYAGEASRAHHAGAGGGSSLGRGRGTAGPRHAGPEVTRMCGIVGYVGHRECLPILIEGLKRLEYRGYDSAGVAVHRDGALQVVKAAGKIRQLESRLES